MHEMEKIKKRAEAAGKSLVVIHGGANGADALAEIAARKLGVRTIVFEAEWQKYGRAAGPIRNNRMITEGKPDFGLAFGLIRKSSGALTGTGDMVAQLLGMGVSVYCVCG